MPSTADLSHARVLIVDDEPDTLEVIRTYLEMQGVEVRSETSAEKAIHALGEFEPEVVLSDISMPGLDGIDLIQQVKLKKPGLPVIAITAHYDDEAMRARIARAGFARTLVKPVDPRAVVEAIALVLGR